jgi:hypothetical protein
MSVITSVLEPVVVVSPPPPPPSSPPQADIENPITAARAIMPNSLKKFFIMNSFLALPPPGGSRNCPPERADSLSARAKRPGSFLKAGNAFNLYILPIRKYILRYILKGSMSIAGQLLL